jgi:hypothetical protein
MKYYVTDLTKRILLIILFMSIVYFIKDDNHVKIFSLAKNTLLIICSLILIYYLNKKFIEK